MENGITLTENLIKAKEQEAEDGKTTG